jgi:predicted nucleotidyltransferase
MSASATVLGLPQAPPQLANDPILRRIKADLASAYGSRLAGVVLYGSRARGDYREDSDIDIVVLLRGEFDKVAERWRLARLSTGIFMDTGKSPSFLLREEHALERQTIFNHSVREEGVRL